jgi:hypothetical protein
MIHRSVRDLGMAAGILTIVACLAGLLFPALYEQVAYEYRVQIWGQDLVSAMMAVLLVFVSRLWWKAPATRILVIMLGIEAYLVYTYAFYALQMPLTPMVLLYIATFSVSLYAVVLGLRDIDWLAFPRPGLVDRGTKVAAGMVMLACIVIASMWIGGLVLPYVAADRINPDFAASIREMRVIVFLDLGLLLPAGFAGAVLALRGLGWGYLLISVFLVKACTLLLALVCMSIFQLVFGAGFQPILTAFWALLLILLGMMMRNVLDRIGPQPESLR